MKNIVAILVALIMLFVLCTWLTSCSTIHKVFDKHKSKIDSTSVIHERKDSTVEKDTFKVLKQRTETEDEVIFDFGDKLINVPVKQDSSDGGIYIYPTNPSDYFEITDKGIKTTMLLTRVTIKGKSLVNTIDSMAGHSRISLNEKKDDSNHLAKKESSKALDKHVSRFPVIPFTIAGLIVVVFVFVVLFIRRKKKQIEAAAKLIIPPPGL